MSIKQLIFFVKYLNSYHFPFMSLHDSGLNSIGLMAENCQLKRNVNIREIILAYIKCLINN